MRPIAVVLLALAVGIAGLTAVLVTRLMAVQAVPVPSPQPVLAQPATDDILVATIDLKPGAVLKPNDLRYETWPSKDVDQRFVRRGAAADPKTSFVGTIARRQILAGEPMTPQAVFRQDEAGLLAGMLSPGMRAVAVPVSGVNGVGGFILPEDHVDIVLNQDVRAAASASAKPMADLSRFASEVVLSDVRVLAIDEKLAKPDAGANMGGKIITVEVSPKDAEVLLTALKMGELALTLRSLAPGETGEPPAGYTSDIEVSRALRAATGLGRRIAAGPASANSSEVRINRGGATTTQSFSN